MGFSNWFQAAKGEHKKHAYHTPLEQKLKDVLSPFQKYIQYQATASILLLLCTIGALIWASIPVISAGYEAFVNLPIGIHFAYVKFEKPLHYWVNDFLLTLFFFFVGLEIKREVLVGELASYKKSAMVIWAACGGMLIPALSYLAFNIGTSTIHGWGIPMATDTAFTLGVLICFRNYLPKSIFTFIAALAIIDDIGAIIVIATVYSTDVHPWFLLFASLLVGGLIFLNYAGVRRPFPYIIIGLIIWGLTQAAGIHGTIAGIIVAFIIPARPKKGPRQFLKKSKKLIEYYESKKKHQRLILSDPDQHAMLEEMQDVAQEATTPLQRWESRLELPIALFVLPLFALVNAGVPLNLHLIDEVFTSRVSLGILLGLLVGKPLGVMLFSRLAIWFRMGQMPSGLTLTQLLGASFLTGIGFTMSLFITNLTFVNNEALLTLAKAAIIIASLCAAVIGSAVLLYRVLRKRYGEA